MSELRLKADRFVNLKLEVIKRSHILPGGENYYGPQRAWNFMRLVSRFFPRKENATYCSIQILSQILYRVTPHHTGGAKY